MADKNSSVEVNSDLINATFTKLSDSLLQQAALSINSVQVPEFHGLPDEDVEEFRNKFELATLAFTDQHKCLALKKALKNAAFTWSEANLRDHIARADWTRIKALLVERFGPADQKLHYRKKLSTSKFEIGKTTLMAYVEGYLATYAKAFPNYLPNDAIHSLRCNLPDQIIKGLNTLDDSWVSLDDLTKFYALVSRYEKNILAFEQKEDANSQAATQQQLKIIIEELRARSAADAKKAEEAKQTVALAAIDHQTPSKPSEETKYQYSNQRPRYNNSKGYKRHEFQSRRNDYSNKRFKFNRNYQNNNQSNHNDSRNNSQQSNNSYSREEQSKAYYARFGDKLDDCKFCGGKHLHKHCPTLRNDLN